ncbi:ATP-dependent dethiobiotin synthetase BioD 1 [Leclercia adecarboxylata]|uniref:ATP-dependent dethiobiotin synthetase BioD 1 n=1 Tax=Leclercia adecarboxylata TaxID=83655 RepID=A0A4U9HMX5_9ENTR|nr:ATP-dependent dethiobiotin synthetase BioD 1 [Leclercia adecarboxylata]
MGLLNVTERYFVTGTDTEVGKTVASHRSVTGGACAGSPYRGIQTGGPPVAEMTAAGLRNSDALALQRNSSVALSYPAVNPYTFARADLTAYHQRG